MDKLWHMAAIYAVRYVFTFLLGMFTKPSSEDMDDIRGEELSEILKREVPWMKCDVLDRAKHEYFYHGKDPEGKIVPGNRALVQVIENAWSGVIIPNAERTAEQIADGVTRKYIRTTGYRARVLGKGLLETTDIHDLIEYLKTPADKPDPHALILNFEDSLI